MISESPYRVFRGSTIIGTKSSIGLKNPRYGAIPNGRNPLSQLNLCETQGIAPSEDTPQKMSHLTFCSTGTNHLGKVIFFQE